MKKSGRFLVSVILAFLLTIIFAMPVLAGNKEYSIKYKVSPEAIASKATDYLTMTNNSCVDSTDPDLIKDPAGSTAKDIYNGYKFVRWIEEGTTTLPDGWYTENDGLTLKFNPAISGAERKTRFFVAEYEVYTEPESESSTEDITETATNTETPSTGDNNNMVLWIVIAGVAIVAIVVAIILLTRRR